MASGWVIYCEPPDLVHGNLIFAASTLRREKTRWDLFTGASMTAQSR